MSPLTDRVAAFWSRVNGVLFPALEEAGIEMTPKLYQLVTLLDLLQIELFVPPRSPYQVGAKPSDRRCLARAFVAKAFYNATDTKAFRERLLHDKDLRKVCGWAFRWEVPSESTFSRAFAWFADLGMLDQVQAAHVQAWLGDTLIRDVSTDSTAIEAREQPVSRAKPATEVAPAEPTRLERQLTQVAEIALLELPGACDVGCKTNSQGNKDYWIGYKFHVRVADGKLPLVAVTTSASVHDSQLAIPLMQLSDRLVTSLYELMDRAYDAKWIRWAGELAGHVPIIDYVKRRGQERARARRR